MKIQLRKLGRFAMPTPLTRRKDSDDRYFIEKFAAEYKRPITGLVRAAQTRLPTYPSPGNIRELENVIGNALSECEQMKQLLDLQVAALKAAANALIRAFPLRQ
ncbi:MAG: hypothetical protein ABSA27_00165 [Terriglobales bacterium]